jgi:hypothetical protein
VTQAVNEAVSKKTDLMLERGPARGRLSKDEEESFVVKAKDEDAKQLTIKIQCLGNNKFKFDPEEDAWKVDANVRLSD